jgi:ribonuclease Z
VQPSDLTGISPTDRPRTRRNGVVDRSGKPFFMRVMPLGTSSGRPTSERQLSGYAVEVDGGWILVDCGEGTQFQLMKEGFSFAKLKAILITHLHGDHILGLPGLLSTLKVHERTERLPVVGTEGLGRWLDTMIATPLLGSTVELDVCELVDDTLDGTSTERIPCLQIGNVTVEASALKHRVPSFGFRISEADRSGHVDMKRAQSLGLAEGPEIGRLVAGEPVTVNGERIDPTAIIGPPRRGPSVVICGDTAECVAADALAAGADLYVHESTYAEAEAAMAEQWRHSTAGQAAQSARNAEVGHLVLTHFSSRYGDLSVLLNEARAIFDSTTLAVEREWIDVVVQEP